MSRNGMIKALAAIVVVLACNDGAAPLMEADRTSVPASDFQPARWQEPSSGFDLSGIGNTTTKHDGMVRSASAGGASTYDFSFWAVQGRFTGIQLYRVVSTEGGDVYQPYSRLEVPANALLATPDGTPIAEGDSILVTQSVSADLSAVHLYPAGLQFKASVPSRLSMWYDDTGMDDGDEEQLAMWYQPDVVYPWTVISAYQSTSSNYFRSLLNHFSGYAVAY